MLKPPCERKCPDRHAGCHGRCERYLEYAEIVGEARERRRKFHEQEAMFYGRRSRR